MEWEMIKVSGKEDREIDNIRQILCGKIENKIEELCIHIC